MPHLLAPRQLADGRRLCLVEGQGKKTWPGAEETRRRRDRLAGSGPWLSAHFESSAFRFTIVREPIAQFVSYFNMLKANNYQFLSLR